MSDKDLFGISMPEQGGEHVKGWCACGQECDCVIQVYSNGTRHAIATCPKCGMKNAKQQRLAPSLEEFRHRLMGVRSAVLAMVRGVEQDEAIAMVERLCVELSEETIR